MNEVAVKLASPARSARPSPILHALRSIGIRFFKWFRLSCVGNWMSQAELRALRTIMMSLVLCCLVSEASAQHATAEHQVRDSQRSIANRTVTWPTAAQWRRVVLLRDYNTRVVMIGVTLLGCACGMVGSFTLLRKRALMGDALSHATLPGIALAFMVATLWGYEGKSISILLLGAALSGLFGVGTILAISHLTRLKEDTALGAVLSVFFGAGAALLGVIQQMKTGHAAGLESFIYGKTASMGAADTRLIAVAAVICIVVSLLLFKELKLLCFDDDFAGSRGLPVLWLDITLMALVVIVTIVGLQAVGLILIIALLIIPAAAGAILDRAIEPDVLHFRRVRRDQRPRGGWCKRAVF